MKIDVSYDHPHLRLSKKETISTVKNVLRREKKEIEVVSVVYTNNSRIRTINGKHLHQNFVTDVIAFELEESPSLETEIYINLDRAKSQAKMFGVTFRDEARRLLIHGLLHVLGYSDKSKEEMARMKCEEESVLEALRMRKN